MTEYWLNRAEKLLSENPDGGTLDPGDVGLAVETSGYFVAKEGYEGRFPGEIPRGVLNAYLELAEFCGCFVGWWKSDGMTYLDLTDHVEGLRLAQDLGKSRRQKAIFDVAGGKEIFL